jgi:hypothetical protein
MAIELAGWPWVNWTTPYPGLKISIKDVALGCLAIIAALTGGFAAPVREPA